MSYLISERTGKEVLIAECEIVQKAREVKFCYQLANDGKLVNARTGKISNAKKWEKLSLGRDLSFCKEIDDDNFLIIPFPIIASHLNNF